MHKEQFKILKKVENYISENNMICAGDRILLGVSGGADSVCMLLLFYEIKDKYNIEIAVAHLNHCLRGDEADRDENFARDLCAKLNVSFFAGREDVPALSEKCGKSIEDAGRDARYAFFGKLRNEYSFNKIATAHNKNDNAETFLLNLIRGSGPDGLKGIPPVRADGVIRPVLCLTREEIERFLLHANQDYVTDSTNAALDYARNRVRSELIPLIEKNYNPNIISTLNRTAALLSADADYIAKQSELSYNGGNLLNCTELNRLHKSISSRIVRLFIKSQTGLSANISNSVIERALALSQSLNTGAKSDINAYFSFLLDYGALRIVKNEMEQKPGEVFMPLVLDAEIKMPDGTCFYACLTDKIEKNDNNIACFDYNSLKGQIYIRGRQNGDCFYPSGMAGKKKLKDFFIDAKIPRSVRDNIPLVTQGNEALWIPRIRHSSRFAANENTKTVLMIKCYENGGTRNEQY